MWITALGKSEHLLGCLLQMRLMARPPGQTMGIGALEHHERLNGRGYPTGISKATVEDQTIDPNHPRSLGAHAPPPKIGLTVSTECLISCY
jgi:hypothetical protein